MVKTPQMRSRSEQTRSRVARFCAEQIRAGAHVTMAFFKLHSRLDLLCCWRSPGCAGALIWGILLLPCTQGSCVTAQCAQAWWQSPVRRRRLGSSTPALLTSQMVNAAWMLLQRPA